MLEIDRLKWAIFCGYNPYKRFCGDCCGYVSMIIWGGRK